MAITVVETVLRISESVTDAKVIEAVAVRIGRAERNAEAGVKAETMTIAVAQAERLKQLNSL